MPFPGYANAGPNASAWDSSVADWQAANPGATRRFGGGPGDVGFGPGVMPGWFGGSPLQQAAVSAVANNPNLLHGWQASAIPQWQIDAQFPGGSGWVPGVTPLPPGWVGQPVAPVFGGGPQHQGARFLGPPVAGGPAFKGPPVHQHSPSAALRSWLGG